MAEMDVTARLAGVEVPEQTTRTDAEGFYAFYGLGEGNYEVRAAESEGYAVARIFASTGVGSADLVVMPQRQVWVQGTVVNTWGEPLSGVHVMPLGQPEQGAYTNQSGNYGIDLVVEGRSPASTIRFYQEGYRSRRVNLSEAQFGADQDNVLLDVRMKPVETYAP